MPLSIDKKRQAIRKRETQTDSIYIAWLKIGSKILIASRNIMHGLDDN